MRSSKASRDFEDDDDDFDDRPVKKKKKKSKGNGGSSWMLYLGIGCGAIGLVFCCCSGVVGGFFWWLFSTPTLSVPSEQTILLTPFTRTHNGNEARMRGVNDGVPFKTVRVNLKAGKNYIIDLTNPTFNPAVRRPANQVLDPFLIVSDKSGRILARDDDGAGYPNARIHFTPPADGVYTIDCTVLFPGNHGALLLKIRER